VQDPLAHLALTIDAQVASYRAIHDWAHEYCDGRWLATGGGGYEVVDVVPRAWAHLVGIAAHHPVAMESDVPETWRDYVLSRIGRPGPSRMSDGGSDDFRSWATGYDPSDPYDRAVMATRKAVFPLHGLDPYFD
jgi:acetoin utilization protein AcuC